MAASDSFVARNLAIIIGVARSEEHTSELQSRSDLVCRLLLEKKKNTTCLRPPLDRPEDRYRRHSPRKQRRLTFLNSHRGTAGPHVPQNLALIDQPATRQSQT